MISHKIRDIETKTLSPLLIQIPDCPPTLRIQGDFPVTLKYLTVVGARRYSEYGKKVCEQMISALSQYSVTIISGLALGIDGIAHRSALSCGLPTIAVPGSGLSDSVLYPRSHTGLRDKILESKGCLLSEFEDNFKATNWSFPQRNRIMAGLSHATLVIEAELRSGTLITSKYATEYNRDVFTIPHSIFSPTSTGPHMLIKLGATPLTKPEDIISALGFENTDQKEKDYSDCSEEEMEIIALLQSPLSRDILIEILGKPAHITQVTLSILELKGLIEEKLGEIYLT